MTVPYIPPDPYPQPETRPSSSRPCAISFKPCFALSVRTADLEVEKLPSRSILPGFPLDAALSAMTCGRHTPRPNSSPDVTTSSLCLSLNPSARFCHNIPAHSSLPNLDRVLSSFSQHSLLLIAVAPSFAFCRFASASPAPLQRRKDTQALGSGSADATYLPAQIGGIVGSYAVSLIVVASLLLVLSKRRRERLSNGENEAEFLARVDKPQEVAEPPPDAPIYQNPPLSPRSVPRSPVVLNIKTNFSTDLAPASPLPGDHNQYITPTSSTSLNRSPLGVDPAVDQRVVTADRIMAQAQLEDMYKYVMEHDEAKANGVEPPPIPLTTGDNRSSTGAGTARPSTAGATAKAPSILKKEKAKPAQLDLTKSQAPEGEKRQSKASALFAALKSPKKKPKGVNISSPIMTPMSGTFPRESQEMNTIPPRQYAPAPPPPPVPTDDLPFRRPSKASNAMPITPEESPVATQSIDERLGRDGRESHSHKNSAAPTEAEPVSADSEHSQAPLVGLPQSPKPGQNRFPTLPASPRASRASPPPSLPLSPKVGSFSRPNPPSAVRPGGALPLRAYEPSVASPTSSSVQTKQTVFERAGPMSPDGGRTPFTATAVPYSPYQPFTPCVPVTPSLVTKADRKRMKRMEPKTPTLQMVQSTEDLW